MKYAFILILTIGSLLFTSCAKKDKCEDVVCQNNGTCENGTCNCPAGYEGTFCENESIPKSITVTSIKITKWPATRADGSKWDTDNTNPDIYPRIYTMKADGITIDQVIWSSSTVLLNTSNVSPTFSLILPELKFTTVDKKYAMFLFEEDASGVEAMGSGIIFNLKDFIKGRPSTISLNCGSTSTCVLGFELNVKYEL